MCVFALKRTYCTYFWDFNFDFGLKKAKCELTAHRGAVNTPTANATSNKPQLPHV